MLKYFRINDPYRLISIFAILLLLRIPVLISSDLLTLPELNYMIIGEKLSEGAKLYSGIWDSIAPLSALIYNVIDYLFGRSQLTYQIIAYILICYQVYIFNTFLLNNKAYNENTYVPAITYAILSLLCYDMLTLSPILMGLTFILLALKNVFSHIEFRAKRDEDILNIGLFLGIASILYLPFAIFSVCTLLIFLFFTGTVFRRYILMTFGFILPIIISACYFFVTQRFDDFLYSFLSPFTVIERVWYIPFMDIIKLFIVPLLFLLLAFIRMLNGARLSNYQTRITQAMFIWMIFCFLFIVFSDQNSPSVYMVLIPVVAFYLSHYFLLIRRKRLASFAFFLFVILSLTTGLLTVYPVNWTKNNFDDSAYLIRQSDFKDLEGKRILVLDEDIRPYQYSKSATPFFNWQLSQEVFTNLDYYDNLTTIYDGLTLDMPDIIIDSNDHLPELMEKIPSIKVRYNKGKKGYYYLKN